MQLHKPSAAAVRSKAAAATAVHLRSPVYRSSTCNNSNSSSTRPGQLVLRAASQATDMKSDTSAEVGTDLASKKAATRVTVFSAAQYVEGFLADPLKQAGFSDIEFIEASLDVHTVNLACDSRIICIFVNDKCDRKVVEKLAKCNVKLIALRCAGFDRVDLQACQEHGIQVVRVPTYSPNSVAEHAVSLLMALNRRIALAFVRVSAGNYSLTPLVGVELRGKRVAVMGTGAIGTEACRIFKGIGMDVVAYDIAKNPAVEEMGIPYVSIEDALKTADVISLHVPLLKSTHHFINKERIALMKPGAILLNVSRGGLVDADALLNGLENGQIGGLGMDVYENEGSLFFTDWTDLPTETRMKSWDRRFKLLTSYPQVIITPHSAFLTVEALSNIASTTIQNMEEFLEGKPLTNALKPKPPPAAEMAR